MNKSRIGKRIARRKAERTFSSNAVRLSFREIIISALIVIGILFVALPWFWQCTQTIGTDVENFRLAEKYRDNYWLYEGVVKSACERYPVLFLGDSVVWGMYVDNQNTLPAILNTEFGNSVVGNIAIDGLHSVAMETLVSTYGSSIRNKKVLLHYNPLWMNSPKYDLSIKSDFEPHHPRLLPQFGGNIKSDRGNVSEKVGILRERYIPLYGLLSHIRLSFFDNQDFKDWMVENYDTNPFSKVALNLDACEHEKSNHRSSWLQQGINQQDWDWVGLEQSRQFQAFVRVVEMLQNQNNEICVMVGPINPHMLGEKTLADWRSLQAEIKQSLIAKNIECIIARDLPSEYYADASHPLASGYKLLAKQLKHAKMFRSVGASRFSRRLE